MTLALSVFTFGAAAVRVIDREGQPWFVAADVCRILEIGNVSLAVNGNPSREERGGLDDDEKGVCSVNTPGGIQDVLCVSESGLYGLVFKSRRPEAHAFKRWITHEVLPSIRKTGQYAVAQTPALPANYLDALKALVVSEEEKQRLTTQTAQLQLEATANAPKVAFFDAVADSSDTMEFGHAAKLLGIGRNNLFAMCKDAKILDLKNVAYQRYIDLGYFRVIESYFTDDHGETHTRRTTRVYQKGVDFLRRKFCSGGAI